MAQIPDYTALGPRPIPTPSYRHPFVDESGAEIAGATERLGRSLEQVGEQDYTRNVNLARAQASNALLDHEIAVRSQTEQIREQVASGQLPWDKAQQTYDEATAKLPPPTIPNLDPIGQQNLEHGMKRNLMAGQQAVLGITHAGQKQAFVDQFDAALDKAGKLAGMPEADIDKINGDIDSYRPMALEAGIPAATVDKAIQNFKDRNWLNQATQRSMEAKDDMGALQSLEHDLTAADGFYAGKLDTDKRNMVLRTVINDRLILENRALHEQDKREAKAQSAIGRIDEQIATGIPATPDMWANWENVTKGTSFEQDFKQRLDDESNVQKVLREPIEQQLSYVQQRTQQLDREGGTLRDRANLIRLQTAVQQNVNLMQKAPLLFAANRNGTDVAALDFNSLQTDEGRQQFQSQIADRMATLKALRTQYGPGITPLPLLPQEAGQLTSQLEDATPPQRARMLLSLRGAMGDDQAYQSVMRQIAPHSPVTAIAGTMVGANAPAATPIWFDPNFAPKLTDVERVLRGESLLNPASAGKQAQQEQESGKGALRGGMPMPPDNDTRDAQGLRGQFGRTVGDMFRDRPQLADAYYSVFKDAYAALLAEKGDMKGLGDPALAQQALTIALGNRVQFNNRTFSVPGGMDPSQFEGYVHNAIAASAHALKAPADWQERIRGYDLQEIGGLGSGQYQLVSGNTPLVRPDGKGWFTIDLRDQYLAARGAHRGAPDYAIPGPDRAAIADQWLQSHGK